MKPFNLSDWALEHRSLVWYFMIVFMVAGMFAYLNLGREEDPAFTIKTMIISAAGRAPPSRRRRARSPTGSSASSRNSDSLDYTRSDHHARADDRLRQPASDTTQGARRHRDLDCRCAT